MKRGAESDLTHSTGMKHDTKRNGAEIPPVNPDIDRRGKLPGPFEITDGVGNFSDHELSKPLSKPKII